MYIPKIIYQYAPYYWLVVGILLALLGFLVDAEGNQMFRYFSVSLGALSCLWGLRILFMRRTQQREEALEATPSPSSPE